MTPTIGNMRQGQTKSTATDCSLLSGLLKLLVSLVKTQSGFLVAIASSDCFAAKHLMS